MEDKKKSLKKVLFKYTKSKNLSAEELRELNMKQNAEGNKIDMSKAPTPFNRVKNAIKNVPKNFKAILDKDKAEGESIKADRILKKIKRAKSYDDAPNYADGVPTDAYIARFEAEDAKDKIKNRLKKGKGYF